MSRHPGRTARASSACALLLLCSLAAGSNAAAAGEPSPPPDGEILRKDVLVTVRADGTVSERVRLETRVDSIFAVSNLCDPHIRYDRNRQELAVLEAAVRLPDGTLVESPPHAINSATPQAAVECPAFAAAAEMVVSFVAVEPGAVLLFEYEVADREPWRPHAEGVYFLGDEFPTREAHLKIRVSARLRFDHRMHAPSRCLEAAEPILERADTVYEWRGRDLPAFPFQGAERYRRTPWVAFSTAESWEALLAGQMPPPLDSARDRPLPPVAPPPRAEATHPSGRPTSDDGAPPPRGEATAHAPLPDDIDRLLRMLVPADVKDPIPVLLKGLFQILRRFPAGISGTAAWMPRPLAEVAASRQATPVEAALLLAELLRRSGFEARILLVGPPLPCTDIPAGRESTRSRPGARAEWPAAYGLVTGVFVEVRGDNGLLVDVATMRHGPLPPDPAFVAVADPGRRSFVAAADDWPAAGARIAVTADLQRTNKGIRVVADIDSAGAASLWQVLEGAATRKAAAAGLLGRILPGATMDAHSVSRCLPAHTSLRVEGTLVPARGRVPVPLGPLADQVDRFLAEWLSGAASGPTAGGPLEYEAVLRFEGLGEPALPPSVRTLAGDGSRYEVEADGAGGRVTVRRAFVLDGTGTAAGSPCDSPAPIPPAVGAFLGDNDGFVILPRPAKEESP